MSHNPIIAITTIDGFDVYPETGKVISHHQKTTNSKPGEEIGKQKGNGYRKIRINGKTVNLHRYIYETVHNVKLSPDQFINHINMDKTDNRIDNLEIVTRRQNNQWKEKSVLNTTGYKGVYLQKSTGLWRACITLDGIQYELGYRFATAEEAYQAYCSKAKEFNETQGCKFFV